MTYDLLIANGLLVNSGESRLADVAIAEGKIVEISDKIPRDKAARSLDAAGRMVMPGAVDVHVHLDMPVGDIRSADDFETGTIAAAFGGTTTVIDFANQSRGQTLHEAVQEWKARADGKAVIDYGLHCTISDFAPTVLSEMDELVDEGISSFKVFTAYPGRLMLDDASIFRILQQASRNGALVCVHAENGPVIDVLIDQAVSRGQLAPVHHARTRPTASEAEAVHRVIALAQIAQAPLYVVHVSCEESLQEISKARAKGQSVSAETCPQYLFLSLDSLKSCGDSFEAAKYVFTPPPRESNNHEALWNGLKEGTLQVVSTDHCPFNYYGQKDRGARDFRLIPNGLPGIEHRLSLLYTGGVNGGHFSENRFVDLVSTSPAKLFGLYPRKGVIAPGSDADVVIWNPGKRQTISARTHHMRVDYSAYEGFETTGAPEVVVAHGKVIVDGATFRGRAGEGKFLKRLAVKSN